MTENLINVFISYAHESSEFRESVRQLALWLNANSQNRIIVTTDHKHTFKAPKEGWPIWMLNQIQKSQIVLIVCTEKYKKRFLKDEEPEQGKGVIYEGSIITSALYNDQMMNEKFIPIIPDGGTYKNVPVILQAFFNGLSFPKNNPEIMSAILDENPYLKGDIVQNDSNGLTAQIVLEEEIVEMINPNYMVGKSMFSSIHALVRAFLLLSDGQKIQIARKLSVFDEEYLNMLPNLRDKEIIKKINDNHLISELWDEVNNFEPFNLTINPFKK